MYQWIGPEEEILSIKVKTMMSKIERKGGKNLKLSQDVFLFHPEDLEGFFRTSQTIASNVGTVSFNCPQSIQL